MSAVTGQGRSLYGLAMENEGLYQTVIWNKATPHERSFGIPLTRKGAEDVLRIAKRTGSLDGKVVPYSTEPGHYKSPVV